MGLRTVHPAGPDGGPSVRPSEALPYPRPQGHRPPGRPVLPFGGQRVLPLSSPPDTGANPGLYALGLFWRAGPLFLRLFTVFTPALVLLGRYFGVFGPPSCPAPGRRTQGLQKNSPFWKKCLLFLAQMLYNERERVQTAPERSEANWQGAKKRSSQSPKSGSDSPNNGGSAHDCLQNC